VDAVDKAKGMGAGGSRNEGSRERPRMSHRRGHWAGSTVESLACCNRPGSGQVRISSCLRLSLYCRLEPEHSCMNTTYFQTMLVVLPQVVHAKTLRRIGFVDMPL